MQTLVPIGTFEDRARELLSVGEFQGKLEFLAKRPKAGRIIQDTGGLRGADRQLQVEESRLTVDNKLFHELEGNLRQAVKFAKGGSEPKSVYFVLSPVDIKEIRTGVNMSQAVFARTFHLSLDTVKGWEQGKRTPDAAATNYLRMIKVNPDYVKKALTA